MPPQRSDLVLTANVPDIKFDVLVGNSLDVEADRGDRSDVLAQLELIEDGGLAGGVEAQHEQAHLLGSEDLAHHLGKLTTHCGGSCASSRREPDGLLEEDKMRVVESGSGGWIQERLDRATLRICERVCRWERW